MLKSTLIPIINWNQSELVFIHVAGTNRGLLFLILYVYLIPFCAQMLQSASKGRLSVHRADIMTFYIPDAFHKADVVRWESNGKYCFV